MPGGQLVEVAHELRRDDPRGVAGMSFGIAPRLAAVDVRRRPSACRRARGSAAASSSWTAPGRPSRDHDGARRGRREDQSPAAVRVLARELLRECAAPRDADHVDLLVAQPVEQSCSRAARGPRSAAAASSSPSGRCRARRRSRSRVPAMASMNGKTQLEVRADAVEQQQRQAAVAVLGRDAQIDAIDLDELDPGGACVIVW